MNRCSYSTCLLKNNSRAEDLEDSYMLAPKEEKNFPRPFFLKLFDYIEETR